MDISTLIESFAEFAKQKNIDRPTMIRILEDVFRNMIKKKYGVDENGKVVPTENFDIIINADKGDLEIYRIREIVEDDSEDIWDHDKLCRLLDAHAIAEDPENDGPQGPADEGDREDHRRTRALAHPARPRCALPGRSAPLRLQGEQHPVRRRGRRPQA